MKQTKTQKLITAFYRARAKYYRWNRLFFPSAAEVRLIEIMGGKMLSIKWIKHHQTKHPLTFVFSLGNTLQHEKFNREVRAGRYYIDFGNDLAMGLEVDGAAYHRDVVKQFDRDSYLYQRGWRIIHIPAVRLWNDPTGVQQQILSFIYD